ncbi:pentulose/hexulose kinase [Mycobacteroides abscessus subsp. abscessus]|nr:pentulose/hexulose kinase [Mycobacteroides abscessus subsp. abscessus]
MSYVIGIDLGTSSLKGLLVDKEGKVLVTKSSEYELLTPQPKYSEQNPNVWIEALDTVLKEIIVAFPEAASETEGISFSGQMHSLVLLDGNGEPLRNAILWNDVRTSKQCQDIMGRAGQEVIRITKNKALEGFTLPKLLWVKENEPALWEKATDFLLPKDYLGFYLTGNKQMEYSDAAGTLLLNVEEKVWSESIAELFDLPLSIFPKLVESSDKIGVIKKELAEKYGFTNDIAVFSGGADNACAAVGAGIVEEGMGLASIGTSGVFLSYEQDGQQEYEGKVHYFNHAIKDSFYSMGVTLSAGYSLNWFKNTFAADKSYDQLLANIDNVAIGSDGLLFTPYIMGERTPYTDSQIRGSFIGMDARHTLDNFARAVIEGITFSLNDSKILMEENANKQFTRIVSVGGGAKNSDWLQIQADIFNAPVVNLTVEQGPGLGAAMIAAVGLGWFPTMNECVETFVQYKEEFQPIPENVKKYEKVYEIYKGVYAATKETAHKLHALND